MFYGVTFIKRYKPLCSLVSHWQWQNTWDKQLQRRKGLFGAWLQGFSSMVHCRGPGRVESRGGVDGAKPRGEWMDKAAHTMVVGIESRERWLGFQYPFQRVFPLTALSSSRPPLYPSTIALSQWHDRLASEHSHPGLWGSTAAGSGRVPVNPSSREAEKEGYRSKIPSSANSS